MATVDIIIRTIDQSQAGLVGVKKGLGSTADSAQLAAQKLGVLSTVVSSTTALIAASYKSYSNLAESVRDLSLISGESAESTSRFIQVLDDFQLTAEDATVAARKLKEKGLAPNIETLTMLSDEFKKIEDPALRLQYVQENLGRAGAKWVNVLNQGGDALRQISEEVNKNLILTENQIRLYEIQRLALDNVSDSFEGFKTKLGSATGNVIAYLSAMQRATEIQAENTVAVRGGEVTTLSFDKAVEMAIAEQLKAAQASVEQGDALIELQKAAEAAAEANKLITESNKEFLSTLGQVQSAEESYQDKSKSLTQERIDLEQEKAKLLAQGWSVESEKIQEINGKLEENTAAAQINAEEHELANKRIILSLLERKLMQDGVLDDKELQWLLEKGQAWGIYSATVVEQTQKAISEANALIDTLITEKTFTLSLNTLYDTYGDSARIASTGGNAPRRARGGAVSGGGMYEVNEGGIPELLEVGNKQFLMMPSNQSGVVTPTNSSSGGGGNNDTNLIIIALLQKLVEKPAMDKYEMGQVVQGGILQVSR